MMSRIFTRTFRVRWSETNADGEVDFASYLRYLIEAAWDWGAAGGLSLDDIKALGQTWVIRETEFNLFRPLCYNDLFEFTIWLVKWRRVRGTRAFELKLQDSGEVVAQGVQQVAVLDSQTMRPTSPPEHLLEYYRLDNPRVFAQQRFPRVPAPPEAAFVMERRVEERDLDQLDIVENAVYAAYAEEAAVRALAAVERSPADLKARGLAVENRRIHIQYQSPAVWGDRLRVFTYLLGLGDTGGDWVVAIQRLSDGLGIAKCILSWTLVGRASGEALLLPESLRIALKDKVAITA
jgi:YbgC/YbaW family acyl-CoA thioester hydrolase